MRKAAVMVLAVLLLCGCGGNDESLDRAMALRADILAASCSFNGEITADYGDSVYTFQVRCEGDSSGDLGFEVTGPETISGIRGVLTGEGGKLTFDDTALEFPMLADGQVTPVSAPWLLLKTLRGGYMRSVGEDGDLLRVTIDDSYEEDALQLDIWLDDRNLPVRAEVLYDDRRILALTVTDFQIL